MKHLSILTALCLLAIGCSPENSTPETPVKNLTTNDIAGVWTNPSNNLYFLALSKDGKYKLCLDKTIMGAGSYELNNNVLTLQNAYLFTKDEINVKINNGNLVLSGHMLANKGLFLTPIDLSLKRSGESFPKSVAGEKRPLPKEGASLPGLPVGYKKVEQKAEYLTEYTAYFVSRGLLYSGYWENFCEYEWYYVYREPYTYTQLIDGIDGNVTIYNLDKTSLHKYLTTNIVEQ
jgi:hypothetical protein